MQWFESMPPVHWGQAAGVVLGGYLLGCFTAGYYLVRWRTGRDLREMSSGTLGARNAGRALGWVGFVLTLLVDSGKGALVVAAAQYLTRDTRLAGLALLSVVAGHIWPAQFRFRGGKGIACSLGGLLVYDFRLVLACAVTFAALYVFLRKVVPVGLCVFACLPLLALYIPGPPANAVHGTTRVAVAFVLAVMVLAAHRKELSLGFARLRSRRPTTVYPHSEL